jgi:hypothetical protein
MLTGSLGAVVGLGAEADITRDASNLTAQSLIPGLPVLSLVHGGAWNALRPNATAGAFYNLSATQRLFLNGGVGQQAWTTRTFASGALGYQMAF